MNRIPGKKEDKLKVLETIGEKEFPYLIGDILFFELEHSDIKIMDGPGDGRRDIYSEFSEQEKCITQCKFHYDSSKSVSSRETDEIIIALNKFGSKKGLFCTNGRISPQGKREYLDNYPEFDLKFLEGMDIVDLILSNPSLSYVWFSNGNISHVRHEIGIPFVVNSSFDFESIDLTDLNGGNLIFKIVEDYFFLDDFEPYRPIKINQVNSPKNKVKCFVLVGTGASFIHEIEKIKEQFLNFIVSNCSLTNAILRFGKASFGNFSDDIFQDKITINADFSETYILSNHNWYIESEWLLPQDEKKWIFPKRLGCLEAPWAAWYNSEFDICLTVEIKSEYNIQPSFVREISMQKDRERLSESLFVLVSDEEFQQLAKKTLYSYNWHSNYGIQGKIVGWLNPILLEENSYPISLKDGKPKDEQILEKEKYFLKSKPTIIEFIKEKGFKTINPDNALKISEIEEKPILTQPKYNFHSSAELYHYYTDIPSPINPKYRELLFMKFWEVPYDLDEVRIKIEESVICDKYANYMWDIRIAPSAKKTYVNLLYLIPSNLVLSTSEIIEDEKIIFSKDLFEIETKLKSIWNNVETATEKFWNNEYGIYFRFNK